MHCIKIIKLFIVYHFYSPSTLTANCCAAETATGSPAPPPALGCGVTDNFTEVA